MTSIDDALSYNEDKQKQEEELRTIVQVLTTKVTNIEQMLQKVLDSHIKKPEPENTIRIGGKLYYRDLLAAEAGSNSTNSLTLEVLNYPTNSVKFLVE